MFKAVQVTVEQKIKIEQASMWTTKSITHG
jgi:hypothetical protein